MNKISRSKRFKFYGYYSPNICLFYKNINEKMIKKYIIFSPFVKVKAVRVGNLHSNNYFCTLNVNYLINLNEWIFLGMRKAIDYISELKRYIILLSYAKKCIIIELKSNIQSTISNTDFCFLKLFISKKIRSQRNYYNLNEKILK